MGLEEEFYSKIKEWKAYCWPEDEAKRGRIRNKPDPRRFRDCDAYRDIVKMGEPVLPYLANVYASEDDREAFFALWDFAIAIEEITKGRYKITVEKRGDTREIRKHAIEWLMSNGYFKPETKPSFLEHSVL